MKKRLLMLMMASLMVFGTVACGADDSDDESKSEEKDKDKDKDDDKEDDKENDKEEDKKEDEDKEEDDGSSDDKESEDGEYVEIDDSLFEIDEEEEYGEYVSDKHYNIETRIMEVCDYDENVLFELHAPEGFIMSYASESGGSFDLRNRKKSYDNISIDNYERLYIANYIRDGEIPEGFDEDSKIEDYKVTYNEYNESNVKYLIARESYVQYDCEYTYQYILVPYKLAGKVEYLSMSFVVERTEDELKDLAREILGL